MTAPAAMPSEERFPVLRDKLELWRQQSVEGNMGLRDYHRRAVLELEALLTAEAALAAERERCAGIAENVYGGFLPDTDFGENFHRLCQNVAAAIRAQGG